MRCPDLSRMALRGRIWAVMLIALGLTACGGSGSSSVAAAAAAPAPPAGTVLRTETAADALKVQVRLLQKGLNQPWGLAFLPDGSLLVTERPGTLKHLNAQGAVLATVSGVPAVAYGGQGGLLDVVADPAFAQDPWIYLSYAEPGTGAEQGLAGTAVARARLRNGALEDLSVIFRQSPKSSGGNHFGSRMVFARDGALLITLGERARDDPANPGRQNAQNLATTLGKVVRIARDGGIPTDNPSLGDGALPGIYSLGHRNPQGAALHPETGDLWLVEHGPQGGDELNHVRAGGNYGWPLRSYGCPYGSPEGSGCRVNGGTHTPDYLEPVSYWVPVSTAPSGLVIHSGKLVPAWKGQAFIGALSGQRLWRVTLDGDREVSREAWLADLGQRIRDVREGPDGALYLLTDAGWLLRLSV
jgi:aldose sugar dehydrogenase